MARKRPLRQKDLDHIDTLVSFFAASDRNAEIMDMMVLLLVILEVEGGSEVFSRKIREVRHAKAKANV